MKALLIFTFVFSISLMTICVVHKLCLLPMILLTCVTSPNLKPSNGTDTLGHYVIRLEALLVSQSRRVIY
jgi:hypothetical protein